MGYGYFNGSVDNLMYSNLVKEESCHCVKASFIENAANCSYSHKISQTTHIQLPGKEDPMSQPAPWVPDEEVSECPLCTQK